MLSDNRERSARHPTRSGIFTFTHCCASASFACVENSCIVWGIAILADVEGSVRRQQARDDGKVTSVWFAWENWFLSVFFFSVFGGNLCSSRRRKLFVVCRPTGGGGWMLNWKFVDCWAFFNVREFSLTMAVVKVCKPKIGKRRKAFTHFAYRSRPENRRQRKWLKQCRSHFSVSPGGRRSKHIKRGEWKERNVTAKLSCGAPKIETRVDFDCVHGNGIALNGFFRFALVVVIVLRVAWQ